MMVDSCIQLMYQAELTVVREREREREVYLLFSTLSHVPSSGSPSSSSSSKSNKCRIIIWLQCITLTINNQEKWGARVEGGGGGGGYQLHLPKWFDPCTSLHILCLLAAEVWWLLLPAYCFQTEAKLSTRNLKGVNINPDCLPTQGFDFETSCKFPKVPHLPVSWLCEFPRVSGIHVLFFKSICLTQPTPEIQSMGCLSTPPPGLLCAVLESAGIRNCVIPSSQKPNEANLIWNKLIKEVVKEPYPELPVLCWLLEGTPLLFENFQKHQIWWLVYFWMFFEGLELGVLWFWNLSKTVNHR